MRIALPTLVVLNFLLSTCFGQQRNDSYRIPDPLQASGNSPQRVERLAQGLRERTAAITHHVPHQEEEREIAINRPGLLQRSSTTPSQTHFHPQPTAESQHGHWDRMGGHSNFIGGYVPISNFNSTQVISPILMTPDLFWNQKHQPILETRNQAMFGIDPACACDEWAGYCGCCGFKESPGHLGIKWLRGNDPCECVECCRLRQRKAKHCSNGSCR